MQRVYVVWFWKTVILGIDFILVISGHEFQLQDLQGQGKSPPSELLSRTTAPAGLEGGHLAETSEQNNIDPQGRLEEVEAPEGSPGTWLEQDGQSGNIWNQLLQYSLTWQQKFHQKICEKSSNVLELVWVHVFGLGYLYIRTRSSSRWDRTWWA